MDLGDGKAVALLFQRHIGLGVHLVGLEAGLAQDQRQRHGETAGMGGADQFLGIGAGLAFEAAGEAVRIVVERAALGGDRALAILEAAMPNGGSKRRHVILLVLKRIACASTAARPPF